MSQEMISLFDYLGYAAGNELGKQVAEYGKIRKTAFGRRQVNTKKYKGEVLLYTREFLNEFFAVKTLFTNTPTTDLTEINTQLEQDSWKALDSENVF
jgi:hypothetical protein